MNTNNRINIKIQKEILEIEYKKKIQTLTKTIVLNGFRKGFVPSRVIENLFSKSIKQELENNFLETQLFDYIKKNNINIINYPKAVDKFEDCEKNIVYVIELELFPTIDLNFDNLNSKKYKVIISENDIDNEINNLLLLHGCWERSSLLSEFGNIVNFDVYEKKNGFLNYVFKNEQIFLDNKHFCVKNFKIVLLNRVEGDEFSIFLNKNEIFYNLNENFRTFFVKINIVMKKSKKELNEKFFYKIGINLKNDFRSIIRNRLMNFSNFLLDNINRSLLISDLIKFHSFIVPNTLVEKKNKELVDRGFYLSKESLEKEVKLNLIFLSIKEKFNINVSKKEVEEFEKKVRKIKNFSNIKRNLENEIYIMKIIKILESKIKFIYLTINFDNLMKISREYEF